MTGNFQHKTLAGGKWHQLPLVEQLGNIGSEVNRALMAKTDEKRFDNAVIRALELFDLTLADPRWRKGKRLKEICRARELFCDAVQGGLVYGTKLEDLNRYFYYFAYAARANR